MKRFLFAAVLALMALPLTSCTPRDANAAELLSVAAVRGAMDGTFWVKLAWRYGVSDGKGPVDSAVVSAGEDGGAQAQEHRHLATVVRDSFQMASVFGSTLNGFACVKAKRRALESTTTCLPWSYTEADAPPPPPIIDSTTIVVGLLTLPKPVTLVVGETETFCTLLIFATGQKALIGGQWVTACEQYETALPPLERASTAQYGVAEEYLSCAIEADDIRRCVDVNGIVTVAPLGYTGIPGRRAA